MLRFIGLIVLGAAEAIAQSTPVPPAFEVASIKPGTAPSDGPLAALREDIGSSPERLTMRNTSLNACIRWAYQLNVYEISGPDWIRSERYDIVASAGSPVPEEQLRLMLRTLLAERFKLLAHRQAKEVSGYALVLGKEPPKLTAAEGGGEGAMTGNGLLFEGHKMPLSRLTDILSSALKIPVRNARGLDGHYDFKLDLRPYITPRQPGDPPLDLIGVAVTAIPTELGLRLESRRVQLDILVVDQAEKRPSENVFVYRHEALSEIGLLKILLDKIRGFGYRRVDESIRSAGTKRTA